MVHRNFNQSIARASNESRNESMHPLKWNQRVNTFTAHRFERAPGVAHVILRKPAPDKICDPTGQTLRHRVLAFCAISANQIGAARDFFEQPRDISRIILQIAIDHHNRLPARGPNTGI